MAWAFYVLILPGLIGLAVVLAAAATAGRVTLHSVDRDFFNGFRELLMWLCGFGTAAGMKSVPVTLTRKPTKASKAWSISVTPSVCPIR